MNLTTVENLGILAGLGIEECASRDVGQRQLLLVKEAI
jgi:hypothetical protein